MIDADVIIPAKRLSSQIKITSQENCQEVIILTLGMVPVQLSKLWVILYPLYNYALRGVILVIQMI